MENPPPLTRSPLPTSSAAPLATSLSIVALVPALPASSEDLAVPDSHGGAGLHDASPLAQTDDLATVDIPNELATPPFWKGGNWNAGHFQFPASHALPARDQAEGDLDDRGTSEDSASASSSLGRRSSSATTAITSVSDLPEPADLAFKPVGSEPSSPSSGSSSPLKPLSSLAPTAAPFVFNPRPVSDSRRNSHSSLPSGGSPTPPSPQHQPFTPASALHPDLVSDHTPAWSFDQEGTLVGKDDSRYQIADEILKLQNWPPTDGIRLGSGPLENTRRVPSVPAVLQASSARPYQPPPRPTIPQGPFPSTHFPPTPPPSLSPQLSRSRSSSIGSPNCYFAPQNGAPHARDRSPTAAQLQAYFGPSSVELTPPPGGEYPLDWRPPPIHDSYGAPTPTQMESEDLLYTQARQTFVRESLASLAPGAGHLPQFAAHTQAMVAHFDGAMASAHPLAVLYGLSSEDANALAREPAKSGVSDVVLRLASLRMSQAREGLLGTAVIGPSANNRKLGLYKTELCRSWEEKGSCRYGSKCQFAHGAHEIREVARHPKFKSEVCRTFWLHGSCPYGRRCCFIHTTLPGGSQPTGPPLDALRGVTNALSSVSLEGPPVPDVSTPPASRLGQRMPSATALRSNVGPFGPALANYLGPPATAGSMLAASSENRPSKGTADSLRAFDAAASSSVTGLFGVPFESCIGLGIKAPGRFTNNPLEVPPTYQDPPQSRLQRLANMNVGTSKLDRTESFHSLSQRGRGGSGSSSSTYSPLLLARVDSTSSVSSLGEQSEYPSSDPGPLLQPVGSYWLGGRSSSALEWATPHHDEFPTPTGHVPVTRSPNAALLGQRVQHH